MDDSISTERVLDIVIGQMGTGKTTRLRPRVKLARTLMKPLDDRKTRVLSASQGPTVENAAEMIIDDLISLEEDRFTDLCESLDECNYTRITVGTIPHYANAPSTTLKFLQDRLLKLFKSYKPAKGSIYALWYTTKDDREELINIPVALSTKGEYVTYIDPTPGDLDRLNIGKRHSKELKYTSEKEFAKQLEEASRLTTTDGIDSLISKLKAINVVKGTEGSYTVISLSQLKKHLPK